MKFHLLLLIIFLCGHSALAQASLTASFDPAAITLGDSTRLVFQSDKPFSAEPDLTPLAGSFLVAGVDKSDSTLPSGLSYRSHYTLTYNVYPRQAGTLTTGDLRLGDLTVPAATLTVSPAPEAQHIPIALSAFTSVDTVYEQQRFFLTIRLSDGVGLMNAQMTTPHIDGARLIPLDRDTSYLGSLDKRTARIFERTYAVIPNRAGTLTIPAFEVYGLYPKTPGALYAEGKLFDGLGGGHNSIRLTTDPLTIAVSSAPTGAGQGWWLPAEDITITAQDKHPDPLANDQTLTRQITVAATGLAAEQLPAITFPQSSDFQIYPDAESRQNITLSTGDIQGLVRRTFVLVPLRSGMLQTPEIHLPWYHTRTHRWQDAVLPAQRIEIFGIQPAPEPTQAQPLPTPKPSGIQPAPPVSPAPTPPPSRTLWIWGVVSFGVALAVMVATILLIYKRKRNYILPKSVSPARPRRKKGLPDLYPF